MHVDGIYNKINGFLIHTMTKSRKIQTPLSKQQNGKSILYGNAIFENLSKLIDYDTVTVDKTQKGWQQSLQFNFHNPHPNPTELIYEKHPFINFLIKKTPEQKAQDSFYQTVKSFPIPIVFNAPKGIMIDNFTLPNGTIAIEGTLNDTFYTRKLYQCAGVSIVDKKNNLQKFLHFFLYSDEKDSTRLLKFLTRGMENPEITIIPGSRSETNQSIEFLSYFFETKFPNLEIKHQHVPSNYNVNDTLIGLRNGELFCTKESSNLINQINPLDKIIHI